MSPTILVACNSCGARFPAETHAGLLRCTPCDDRLAFRLTGTGPLVTQIVDAEATL
ncbi:MAG: hypothetical protein V4510_07790 [bacterium]